MPSAAHLTEVRVAFASGSAPVNEQFLAHLMDVSPVRLFVVSEFPGPVGEWIPWHVHRGVEANLKAVRTALEGVRVMEAAFVLEAHPPLRPMKFAALRCGAAKVTGFDSSIRPFAVSLAGVPKLLGHGRARVVAHLERQFGEHGRGRKWLRRLANPKEAEVPFLARRAQLYGVIANRFRGKLEETPMQGYEPLQTGVTVVIPSRDGKELLQVLFPSLLPQLGTGEIIVSDNGSSDGTAAWLAAEYPGVRVIETATPLSFAKAVNLGIRAAKYAHIFLLNNDMVLEPECIAALVRSFGQIPDLFCSTAQIFFPAGVRREETGKAVWRTVEPLDFPCRCDDPIAGEDGSYVLYGSGGCSLFDTVKLRQLGGVSEVYEPAYVEDMDFGYRAWKRGWPTVYCDGAKVEHRHRSTTSRFFTEEQLQFFVERNYLRFLIYSIGSKELFAKLWQQGIRRLQLLAQHYGGAYLETLRQIPKIAGLPEESRGLSEEEIFALGSGEVAVFPGTGNRSGPLVVLASPYLPYPLSHGGAVRMFNLMRQCNARRGQVLISFVDELAPVPKELLEICAEVVQVKRHGSHFRKNTARPDTVEEFDSVTFRAALRQTIRKWDAEIVQLEFTQMAQYVDACSPAKTLLVEHDITFDLLEQMLGNSEGLKRLELEEQLAKWETFEQAAWAQVNSVVTMSSKDSATVIGARNVVCLPNGVDIERFQPSAEAPEPGRILFLGSFAHLPNLLGLDWFLRGVWPLLPETFTLHVIAGSRPEYFLAYYRDRVQVDLSDPRIQFEGFVADVRAAYRQAQLVIAPLVASAGTNIKVLEAMAMGKPVIATPAGMNGIQVSPEEAVVAANVQEFAQALIALHEDTAGIARIGDAARRAAVERFAWDAVAVQQEALYAELAPLRYHDEHEQAS